GVTDDAVKIQAAIEGAHAVILATPEYHGSYSSVMKLVIENMGFPSRLSRKPVALLGVAAGRIGAIKALEHLRSVASHVGAIVLPGPVSIANVQAVFDESGTLNDAGVEKLIRKLVTGLIDYLRDTTCPEEAFEAFTRANTA
ncbi:MAG: NAD(P)H-dependent oxidoreductase, partial [Bacteroidota bacterium]